MCTLRGSLLPTTIYELPGHVGLHGISSTLPQALTPHRPKLALHFLFAGGFSLPWYCTLFRAQHTKGPYIVLQVADKHGPPELRGQGQLPCADTHANGFRVGHTLNSASSGGWIPPKTGSWQGACAVDHGPAHPSRRSGSSRTAMVRAMCKRNEGLRGHGAPGRCCWCWCYSCMRAPVTHLDSSSLAPSLPPQTWPREGWIESAVCFVSVDGRSSGFLRPRRANSPITASNPPLPSAHPQELPCPVPATVRSSTREPTSSVKTVDFFGTKGARLRRSTSKNGPLVLPGLYYGRGSAVRCCTWYMGSLGIA